MNWPDYAILAVMAISIGVGALRGFIMEVFSLLVWVAAFGVAYHFAGDVAVLMEGSVTLPSARIAMGFTGLFIAVLLVGGLINYLLGRLVESTGLSGTDRLLGGVFGAARGLALVLVLLLVAGLTPLPAGSLVAGVAGHSPLDAHGGLGRHLFARLDLRASRLRSGCIGGQDPAEDKGSSEEEGIGGHGSDRVRCGGADRPGLMVLGGSLRRLRPSCARRLRKT